MNEAKHSDLVPSFSRGRREAQLDMLLAEELYVDHAFLQWLAVDPLRKAGFDFVSDEPVVRVDMNVDDSGGPDTGSSSAGENDLDVTLTWADGTRAQLLIENKV